jgi:hypothetical protein
MGVKIHTVDGHTFDANGQGKVAITIPNSDLKPSHVILKNVMYSPHLAFTLVSAALIDKKGCCLNFGNGCVEILGPNSKRVVLVPQENGLYWFNSPREETVYATGNAGGDEEEKSKKDLPPPTPIVQDTAEEAPVPANPPIHPVPVDPANTVHIPPDTTALQIHHCLGHIAICTIKRMVKDKMITGIDEKKLVELEKVFCSACVQGKARILPYLKERSSPHTTNYGDLIHTNIWGLMSIESIGHFKYFGSFTNDWSCETCIFGLVKITGFNRIIRLSKTSKRRRKRRISEEC